MITKKVERTVVVADNGMEFTLMERPEGLGTFEDYHRLVQEYRKKYPEVFERMPSLDEYLQERRREAALEWKE